MEIHDLVQDVKKLLIAKGFPYDQSRFWECSTLTHSEISELADVIKKKGYAAKDDIAEEIADIVIRTMNFVLMFDIDIEDAIEKKMAKNWDRPYRYNTVHENEGQENTHE